MSTPPPLCALVKSALSPPILVDSLKTGLLVGLILNLINNGHALFDGTGISWGSVLLNFIVPFCVSAYSRAHTCGLPARVPAQSTTDHKPAVY
jgi:hypothetical protein